MTRLRKFVSLLVVTIMVFAMGINVFADSTAKVTITNTTKGDKYSIYKIFDAVVDGDKESYYIDVSTIDGQKIKNSAAACKNADDENVFTLKEEGTDKYRVYIDGSESDVRAWVDTVIDDELVSAAQEPVTSDGSDVVFTGLPLGYYYVSTQNGALICLKDVNDDITISDKRSAPSWDPVDPENPGTPNNNSDDPSNPAYYGKYIKDSEDGSEWSKVTNAATTDVQHFMINAYVPKLNGEEPIYEYVITDTLEADKFTSIGTVTATIKDGTKTGDDASIITCTSGETAAKGHIKIVVTDNVITVSFVVTDIENYPSDAHISITYDANVATTADIYNGNDEDSNDNTATLEWTQYDPSKGDPTDPNDSEGTNPPYTPVADPSDPDGSPFPPPSTTKTYVYGFNLLKIDSSDKDSATPDTLNGAKFNLKDEDDNNIKFIVDDDKYIVSSNGTTDVIEAGKVTIVGIDIYDYSLVEIEAPAGYNKLAAPVSVSALDDNAAKIALSDNNVTVENSKGITLPTTGGIGTRIFYITGATIMLGAIVVLVAKKRTSNK